MWQLLLELTGGTEAGEVGRIAYHELSGFIPSLTVFAAALGLYLHHRCHSEGCWRPGRYHDAEGKPACTRHRREPLHKPAADVIADVKGAVAERDA